MGWFERYPAVQGPIIMGQFFHRLCELFWSGISVLLRGVRPLLRAGILSNRNFPLPKPCETDR